MHGRWWRWLSALLAALCGLAFGWVAGSGVVRAAGPQALAPEAVVTAAAGPPEDRPAYAARCAENHASRRCQPSSAAALR